jgi:hypothetical protein
VRVQLLERMERAALPQRLDELQDLVRRQSALEATAQERYKALSRRVHAAAPAFGCDA